MVPDSPPSPAGLTGSAPSWPLVLGLAAQHVVVLFSGIILVPVMLVNIYDFSLEAAHYLIFATALCAAAAMGLQLVRTGRFGLGLPMFMGTSAAFMSCSHAAIQLGGPALLAGVVLVSAPFQVLFSYLIRYLRHILTPTVGGVIIMLAMVGLLKDSLATWTHGGGRWPVQAELVTGAGTAAMMLLVEWFGRQKLRPWGLPLGILTGCGIAVAMGLPVIPDMADTSWLGLPSGRWPGISFSPDNPQHWITSFTFALAVFAASVKYTGDAMLLQRVADKERRKVDYDAIQGGLYANAVALFLAGLAGGMPSSSHSPNTALMEITGVATRRLAVISGLILGLVAFSPWMLKLLINVPHPVLGGVGVILVAHLFSSGMQLVAAEMNHRNGLVAGLSLCIGLTASGGNFFPDAFPEYLAPLVRNGVALGGMGAVILTLVTHFSTQKILRIAARPHLEGFHRFQERLRQDGAKLGLTPAQADYLELACEEVFLYMREECRSKGYDGLVRFLFRRDGDEIKVEASGGTRFDSEADEIAARGAQGEELLGDAELNSVGLALVSHLAREVSHVTIAGYTYIGFSLPLKD